MRVHDTFHLGLVQRGGLHVRHGGACRTRVGGAAVHTDGLLFPAGVYLSLAPLQVSIRREEDREASRIDCSLPGVGHGGNPIVAVNSRVGYWLSGAGAGAGACSWLLLIGGTTGVSLEVLDSTPAKLPDLSAI